MSETKLVGLILTLAGVAACAVGVFLIMRRRAFIRTSTPVQGTVVGIQERSDSEGGTVYSRVVSFTAADGRPIQFTEKTGYGRVKHHVGDPILVRYQADDPNRAIIGTWFGTWFWPIFPIIVGLGFLLPGILVFAFGGDDAADPGSAATPSIPATSFPPPSFGPTTGAPTAPAGSLLSVRDPSGSGTARATCDGVGETGNERAFRLRLETGDTVILTARPYTGPGVYQAGSTLAVSGTFFDGATDPFSGVIIVESSGQNGSVNVSSGAYGVSGAWDCTGEPVGG